MYYCTFISTRRKSVNLQFGLFKESNLIKKSEPRVDVAVDPLLQRQEVRIVADVPRKAVVDFVVENLQHDDLSPVLSTHTKKKFLISKTFRSLHLYLNHF